MLQFNREKLEALRHVLESQSGTGDEVNTILNIVRAEWDAHYSLNTSCDSCKMDLVRYAFYSMKRDEGKDTITINF